MYLPSYIDVNALLSDDFDYFVIPVISSWCNIWHSQTVCAHSDDKLLEAFNTV